MFAFEDQNLHEIEFLLNQSMNGFHFLFDHSQVARIMAQPSEDLDLFSFDNIERVQTLFSELLNCQTIGEKRRFISLLDQESYEILLRTYFHILDNSLLASQPAKH